jgi:photosystem I subunit 3
MIPGIMFLYIAGLIGWSGRSYLINVRKTKNPEMKEVLIDVPLAVKCVVSALAWPLAALKELTTGELVEADNKIPVGPR